MMQSIIVLFIWKGVTIMSAKISRRQFGTLATLALFTPVIGLLSACSVAGKPILEYLADLAVGTGNSVLGDTINQLLNRLNGNDYQRVLGAYSYLVNQGFVNFGNTTIFYHPLFATYVYAVSFQ